MPTALIDADTGEVLQSWEGLTTKGKPGGGGTTPTMATGPEGNQKTGQYFMATTMPP